ncbi:hypothetical protein FEZ41_09580 [Lentilactobacillus parafarraginis]|jgi:hypothetical protein|uniref:Uncharacterized protein n=3 Tax=Lentilactobacillus parafarraginis TaxID=390842 RepID=A0A5R9CSX9_9LACO|nr:hypothetical protein [Lentilactobacillus parafarraginis]EHM00077.1 hypothetical protein HMPREF9103_00741 [Lentilactobacillus parafarraginis F0439]TLQ18445.1 hypothetical protein FEZ41_09580 [Lentilactobacillus parafarraginis]
MEVLEHSQIESVAKDYLYQFQVVFLQETAYSDQEAGEIFSALRHVAMQRYKLLTGQSISSTEFDALVADLPASLKQGILSLAAEDVRRGHTRLITQRSDGSWRV